MPLINVSDTSNLKGSVTAAPQFKSGAILKPSGSSATDPKTTQDENKLNPAELIHTGVEGDIKEYSAPLPEKVEEPAVKDDLSKELDKKLDSLTSTNLDESSKIEPTYVEPTEVTPTAAPLASDINRTNDVPKAETTALEALNFKSINLPELLRYAINQNASDLHLTVGYRAMFRIDGNLRIANSTTLTAEQLEAYVIELIKSRQNVDIKKIYEEDLTYSFEGRRFRVNIFRQMGNFSVVMRVISEKISGIEDLGLPQIVKTFSGYPNGLVLVTGPTGSGKSTTIASILNLINITEAKHIITLEDPIEYVFPKGLGLVDQREFNVDFLAWGLALRSVLRQDPDVVLIGEMRDLETVEAALQIAETGHLVFATLHTNGATESINRIIDIFESQKQDQIRIQLSSVLRAVVSQKLIPSLRGGRIVASEIMINNPSVANAIRDKKTFQIDNIIQTSSEYGMMSLERCLVNLVKLGTISIDQAKAVSKNPNDVEILLKQ